MISQEIDYYEDMKYQDFLLSSRRKIICPPEKIMYYIEIKDAMHVADFGMGKCFFVHHLKKKMNKVLISNGDICRHQLNRNYALEFVVRD